MGRGLGEQSRGLGSTGLRVPAAERWSVQKQSPGGAGWSRAGKSQVVMSGGTSSVPTFNKWFLLKPERAHIRSEQAAFPSSTSFPPKNRPARDLNTKQPGSHTSTDSEKPESCHCKWLVEHHRRLCRSPGSEIRSGDAAA